MAAVATLGAALLVAAHVRQLAATGVGLESPPPSAPPPRPAPTPSPDRSAFVAAVDALAEDALLRGPIAGLSIAVVERGRALVAKGYGFADVEARTPAGPETSYPIASVTKNFTAALILRLAEEGRLSLDDPLARFFPEARPRIGALTLRHLLQHTSGITRPGPAPRTAAESVLRRGGTARGQGKAWDYSNYNYSLLGLVVEQAFERDYAAVVQQELAEPLGLQGTAYCEDGSVVPGRGRDYLSGPRTVSPTSYWSKPRFFAAGGLCSTVLDLVKWNQALEDGRVLRPEGVAAMRSPTRLLDSALADYGLGTRMGVTAGHRKLGHTGGGQGNKAVLARYPAEDVTIVVLLNSESQRARVTANELEEAIARLLFGLPEGPGPALEALEHYAGAYRDGSRLVNIAVVEDSLTLRPGLSHRPASQFLARGDGTFVAADDPAIELRFQMQGTDPRGYGRYRNGWFVGLGLR